MKKFTSLKSAIQYYKHCPICTNLMIIYDRDLAMDYGARFRKETNESISIYLDSNELDTVTINQDTDELEIISVSCKEVFSRINYSGVFIKSITISCNTCCQFSCILQLHLALSIRKLMGVIINAETISVEVNDVVHEIKNNYCSERTQYTSYQKDGSFRRTTLPLVSLDLLDPKETVSRISKLVIFS